MTRMDKSQLIESAKFASEQAYAVYSNFRVGAAVLGDDDKIYPGCNVENASYGLTICAERTAVFSAVVGGAKKIKAVAIYTPTERIATPCGACRQVLAEFDEEMVVILANRTGATEEYSLAELLPHRFAL